ncbi:MAG: peptidoglycan-binding domain-containing protein [Myxococcaceae bacterium]|nr:peptidoglycan-binding domain-containing protein [Myxococcaceae bacterium]
MSIAALQSSVRVPQVAMAKVTPGHRPAARPVDAFERPKAVSVPVLRRGATGAAVKALQLKLVSKGYLSRSDFQAGIGVFGPRTETAVKRAQVEHGLPVNGVVDARTSAAINAERPSAKPEPSEVATDVFEKPAVLASASQTVTDDDEPTSSLRLDTDEFG